MKRKLIFLSAIEYSENTVDRINGYFDMGWEIEDILNADFGYYLILISKDVDNYDYVKKTNPSKCKFNLIEENRKSDQKWVTTTTEEMTAIFDDKYPNQNSIKANNNDNKCS
jgi:hypothetical protein